MATFEQKYVQWVQRTLNRELDSELITNGVTTSEYREAVETFQLVHDLPLTGQVGSADQNKMIKANHQSRSYVTWAQEALFKVQARDKATATGVMDNETIQNIKSFQAFHHLNDDGWIGAKTEMELIDASGLLPAGHIPGVGPVIRRPHRFYDNPKPRPFVLPTERAVNRIISTNYYDALYNRSALSGEARQQRVCLLGKLKRQQGIDDRYPAETRLSYAYHGSSRYRTASSIMSGAREFLTSRVNHWSAEKRLDPAAGRALVGDLVKEIAAGLRAIDRYRQDYKPSEHASFGPVLAELQTLVSQRKSQSTSILSCFR